MKVILSHGNGPQVGNLMLMGDRAKDFLPEIPLGIAEAMTAGSMGPKITAAIEFIQANPDNRVLITDVENLYDAVEGPGRHTHYCLLTGGSGKVESINIRATRAVIHMDHINHNLDCIRRLTGRGRKICIAVKADAYGHGAVEVSRRALDWGVDFLAVATVHEGIILRQAGITAPVIVFGFALDREIPQIAEWNLTPFVGSRDYVEKLNHEASLRKMTMQVHLKIDTGMGRIGVTPGEAPGLAAIIEELSNLNLQGVCTHFPVSDGSSRADREFTENQIGIFARTVESIREAGIDPGIVHAANSGGIIAHESSHFDMVRPGICLYGYYPDPGMERVEEFKPVMEMVSKVNFIKKVVKGTSISYGRIWTAPEDTWIGTIPAGYADGYTRLLSSAGKVLIRGKLYPVAGRVCMDQFMVDLGRELEVSLFDEAVLFGPEAGAWTAEDIAGAAGTIPYEITCNINKRVPRVYLD